MSIYRITKVGYSSIGITTSAGQGRKVIYIPLIYIDCDEKGEKKRKVHLQQFVPNKKYYTNWIEGKSFIGGITADSYHFFDEEGKLTGNIAIEDVGKVFQVNEDSIICLKGKTIYKVEPTGDIAESRELTSEEKVQLGITQEQ